MPKLSTDENKHKHELWWMTIHATKIQNTIRWVARIGKLPINIWSHACITNNLSKAYEMHDTLSSSYLQVVLIHSLSISMQFTLEIYAAATNLKKKTH